MAVADGKIAGVGDYSQGEQVIGLEGRYLCPGLIDGHFHLESSYLDVGEYALAVVPHETLAGVTDLHEISNVCGLEGLDYILRSSKSLPLDLYVMAPACVPATSMETSGANLDHLALSKLMRCRQVKGLGEFMDSFGDKG